MGGEEIEQKRKTNKQLMDLDSNVVIARGRAEEDIKRDKWRLDKLLKVKIHIYLGKIPP